MAADHAIFEDARRHGDYDQSELADRWQGLALRLSTRRFGSNQTVRTSRK
jgi:hypothetical protein